MKTPHRFGSSSVSEGSLSFGKCTAGLGFRLLGKKHLLILFVLLKTQLCEESRAAGGGRGRGPAVLPARGLSCQQLCLGLVPLPLSGGCACSPPPGRPSSLSAPTLFFSGMHYVSKHWLCLNGLGGGCTAVLLLDLGVCGGEYACLLISKTLLCWTPPLLGASRGARGSSAPKQGLAIKLRQPRLTSAPSISPPPQRSA